MFGVVKLLGIMCIFMVLELKGESVLRMQMKPGFICCNLLRLIMLKSVFINCWVNLKLLKV